MDCFDKMLELHGWDADAKFLHGFVCDSVLSGKAKLDSPGIEPAVDCRKASTTSRPRNTVSSGKIKRGT